jgi:hypothetical protein
MIKPVRTICLVSNRTTVCDVEKTYEACDDEGIIYTAVPQINKSRNHATPDGERGKDVEDDY